MNGRRKDRNLEGGKTSKGGAEKSVFLPVSTISRLNPISPATAPAPPPPQPLSAPKTLRRTSSEEKAKKHHHQEKHDKKRRSKTDRKKGDRRETRSTKKIISKSKESRKTKKDAKQSTSKYLPPIIPPIADQGGEGKSAMKPVTTKVKAHPASCGDEKTNDSDLDQESLLKNKKKLPPKNPVMLPKVSPAPTAVTPSKEDDETLASVDAEIPELALPHYVLPDGEFEEPAALGNDSSKKRNARGI